MLAVNQASTGNRQLSRKDDLIVWTAEVPDRPDRYVALFNAQGNANSGKSQVSVSFSDLGITGKAKVRDLWQKLDLGVFSGTFSQEIPHHGAGLFRVSPQP